MYIHKLSTNLILALPVSQKIYRRKAKESTIMLEIYLCKCSLIVHCMFCLQYIRCNLNILQEAQWCLALQPITFLKRAIKSFSLAWKLSYKYIQWYCVLWHITVWNILVLYCHHVMYMYTTFSIISLSDPSNMPFMVW